MTKGVQGGTYGRGIQMGVALLSLVALTACFDKVIVNPTSVQTIDDHSGNDQIANEQGCVADGLTLGARGDDFTLTAGGEDSITLVVSYFKGPAELVGTAVSRCAATITRTGPCDISGTTVTASVAGACTATANLGAIRSNTVSITAVP